METNKEMPNFTLQFDFSSSSTSEDVNESAVNKENISQMPENQASNNIDFPTLLCVLPTSHMFRSAYIKWKSVL